jgi:peptide/nickel transport system ATP-binding protein
MPPLLSIRHLSIGFRTETGLAPGVQDIQLEVQRSEIVALVGESGSGKSITSLSILQLLPVPPTRYLSGQILFTDSTGTVLDLLKQSPKQMRSIRGRQIAMIFQEPMSSLNPVFTCGQQVMEAIRTHTKMPATRARQETLELFEKVKLPDPVSLFDRYPHQLSGGQKQRVMIAMAISSHPSLLICDEPTTALDVTVQKTILTLIRELQQTEDMGVIFITHDLGVVAEIADRALVLYKGKIVEDGPVSQLFRQPRHPYTMGLLNCRPALHSKGERLPVVDDFMETDEQGRIRVKEPGAAELQAGPERQAGVEERRAASVGPGAASKEGVSSERGAAAKGGAGSEVEILVQVQQLRVWYPALRSFFGKPKAFIRAVDGVSFEIYKGETLGMVGESGSGKTTLGRTLLRLIDPTQGRIIFEGKDLADITTGALKKLRRHIQIVFQDPYSSLNPRLRIGSAIAEPLQVHGLITGDRRRKERVVELLEKVNMKAEHYDRYPHEFSGGQRQRIVIARALALNPSFIVCDESVSALDVSVQAQVLNLLNDLKKEFGFTVVFISHDLSVIRYISDRILVLNKGRIEEIGEAESVYSHPRTDYTQKLIDAIPAVGGRGRAEDGVKILPNE